MAGTASSRASSRPAGVIAACLLWSGAAFAAALLPAERPEPLPRLTVSDDQETRHELRDLPAGEPALLLPVFTRCTGTCPMTAHFLKEALATAQAPFRVVVLSFDPEDTAQNLRDFRERFALPSAWLVVRSGDAAATRAFLDGLDFHFMKSSGGFDHPNETFVFSPGGAWAATLTGATFAKDSLEAAWQRALAADDRRPLQRLRAWLLRPEAWILIACAGLGAAVIAVLLLARKARRVTVTRG